MTAIKSEQHQQIELCLEKVDRIFTKTLTKIQKTRVAAKNLVYSNETKLFACLIRTLKKSELERVAPSVHSQAVEVCFDKLGSQPSRSTFDRFQFWRFPFL